MRYLTWREMFELREKLDLTDEQLDEPALFTIQDGYGDQTAYPIGHWTESIHPSDGTSTLCEVGQDLEILLPGEFERDKEDGNNDEDNPRRWLRKLPLGGLRLGFSDMDEDYEEAVEWLAQPNPHTPLPGPAPTPLFDTPGNDA